MEKKKFSQCRHTNTDDNADDDDEMPMPRFPNDRK